METIFNKGDIVKLNETWYNRNKSILHYDELDILYSQRFRIVENATISNRIYWLANIKLTGYKFMVLIDEITIIQQNNNSQFHTKREPHRPNNLNPPKNPDK